MCECRAPAAARAEAGREADVCLCNSLQAAICPGLDEAQRRAPLLPSVRKLHRLYRGSTDPPRHCSIQFCTDNAVMIAHAGLLQWSQRTTDMRRFPRAKWSLADLRVQEHEAAQAEAKAQEAQMEQRVEGRAARALRNLDLGPGLGGAM